MNQSTSARFHPRRLATATTTTTATPPPTPPRPLPLRVFVVNCLLRLFGLIGSRSGMGLDGNGWL
ncbi:hypothetical protein Droror1_Dr00017450, partial [Drosera rotundifolia]